MSLRPPLRYAVLVDRSSVPAWQRNVVDALAKAGDAELVAVLHGQAAPRPTAGRADLAWRLYNNRVVARRARGVRAAGTWSEVTDAPVRRISVERRGKWSDHVSDADLAAIRELDLDFVLRFGLGILRGGILDVSRFGVWSYHHDDERVIRGGPPAFWELYDGLETTGVVLQRLTERLDGGIPLARANFRSVLHSYPRNRDRVFLGAADLPARVARAVRSGMLDPDAAASASDATIRRNPTNRQMIRFIVQQARRALSIRARGIARADVWTVGVISDPFHDGGDVGDVAVRDVEWLPERVGGGYFADPFPACRDGVCAILVEEFDEAENRGVISALESTPTGWRLHSGVIDPAVHASYPFLVEEDGELYCVPETWQARRVDLWRCTGFPDSWERVATLLDDVALVDPTVFKREGRWWLMGTCQDDEPDTKLFAWTADALTGPWRAHPLNPLKIDVTSSRPAGPLIEHGGALYRPAQDCARAYGGGIVVQRIVSLDERGLIEERVGRVVMPRGRYESGTHTLAGTGDLWVVDGRRYGVNRHRVRREVRGRLRRLRPRR
jgi:hypothetical protein